MATCPDCGHYLGRNHRCWGIKRQLRSLRIALVGALVGVVPVLVLIDRPSFLLMVVTGALGAVLVVAFRRSAGF